MIGLPYLVSQCAKLHVAGWTWAVFTSFYLLFLWFLQRQSGIFWIHPRMSFQEPQNIYSWNFSENLTNWTVLIFASPRQKQRPLFLITSIGVCAVSARAILWPSIASFCVAYWKTSGRSGALYLRRSGCAEVYALCLHIVTCNNG
jgi:hypothetical protein